MSNSYSGPLTYGPPSQPLAYEGTPNQYSNPLVTPLTVGGVIVGGGVGAYLGNKGNPNVLKNGEIKDTFVKAAYEKYADKAGDDVKKAYEQNLQMQKKIDGVKSAEALKTLFKDNSEAAKEVCAELKQTPEEFLNNVTDSNVKDNAKTIKAKLESDNKTDTKI